MNFIALWSQNESPAPQSRQFLNHSLFRSLPMILNLGQQACSIRGQFSPKFLLCPPNFFVTRKICFKNIIKTKIVPPKNVFCPSKPQNLATGLLGSDRNNISSASGREGFLRGVRGVTLCNKVRSCEIRRALNVDPHLLGIERAQISIYLFRPCSENSPTKDWRGKSNWLNPRKSSSEIIQGPGVVNTPQTLLGLNLVWSQRNYLKLLLTVRYSKSS